MHGSPADSEPSLISLVDNKKKTEVLNFKVPFRLHSLHSVQVQRLGVLHILHKSTRPPAPRVGSLKTLSFFSTASSYRPVRKNTFCDGALKKKNTTLFRPLLGLNVYVISIVDFVQMGV